MKISNSVTDILLLFSLFQSTMRQNVKYCGQDLPHRFDSSRNTLEIRFKSDGENGRRGFKLQYSLQSKKLFSSHISNEIIRLLHYFQVVMRLTVRPQVVFTVLNGRTARLATPIVNLSSTFQETPQRFQSIREFFISEPMMPTAQILIQRYQCKLYRVSNK